MRLDNSPVSLMRFGWPWYVRLGLVSLGMLG